jgi:hypothetical protein
MKGATQLEIVMGVSEFVIINSVLKDFFLGDRPDVTAPLNVMRAENDAHENRNARNFLRRCARHRGYW